MPLKKLIKSLLPSKGAPDLDAQLAVELAQIDATKAHEVEGAASVATWATDSIQR